MSNGGGLQAAHDEMRELVRIIVEISSELALDVTLRRIVEGGIELSGARFGALGIRAPYGGFSSFVTVGVDETTAQRFGDLAVNRIVRAAELDTHHCGRRFGVDGADIQAVFGVPIIVRGAEYGVLFLADDRTDEVFSGSQENAVRMLATAAEAAIDNARLFERERESAKWTKASREITSALLANTRRTGPLQLIVERALELAGAEQAILLIPNVSNAAADEVEALVVAATAGRYSSQVIGQQVPMDGSTTGGVARRGEPLITDSFQYPIEGFTDVGERSAIVMPLTADDAVLGVIAVARDPQQPPFTDDYLDLVSDFARHAALALALAASREHALNQQLAQANSVEDALRAAGEELRRLWRARRVLTVTFPRGSADTEAQHGVPHLMSVGEPADWCSLSPQTRDMVTALRDGDLLTPTSAITGAAGIALQHPQGVLVVWIELPEQRVFTLEDQTLLTVLAGRLGQGLHRLHQVDQQRETAIALQHAILGPAQLPSGFSVRYQAASSPLQVGGDWFDIIDLDGGRIAFVVGDCVGHGLAAATVMGQVRSACRALLLDNPSPAAALMRLDRFAERLPGARTATAVCAVLDPASGELVYSSAGHPPPIVVNADGTTSMLDGGHTIALGIRRDWHRPEARAVIAGRATLLLYTDGLIERRDTNLEQGFLLLAEAARRGRDAALEDLADRIMTDLAPVHGYQDDVVLLMYRHPGPLQLDFPADLGQLAPIRTALRQWLRQVQLEPDDIMNVLVAAGEAVANAIEHGHQLRPSGTVSLRASVVADRLHIAVTDNGAWKAPSVNNSHRGRGIDVMRALMHHVVIAGDTSGTTVHMSARITS